MLDQRLLEKVENACGAYWHKKPNTRGVSLSDCLNLIAAAYGDAYVPHARQYVIETICGLSEDKEAAT